MIANGRRATNNAMQTNFLCLGTPKSDKRTLPDAFSTSHMAISCPFPISANYQHSRDVNQIALVVAVCGNVSFPTSRLHVNGAA